MKELRIGLVLYGGVSLAVYMNGVVTELWHLLQASQGRHRRPLQGVAQLYAELLGTLAAQPGFQTLRVVVDAVAGSSAGGVNGAVLAKAITEGADASVLSRVWLDEADFLNLRTEPTRRAPGWVRTLLHLAVPLYRPARELRRTAEQAYGIEFPWLRDQAVSLLAGRDGRATPLDGRKFTRLIAGSLKEMAAGPPAPPLLPDRSSFDLFLTQTDYGGWPRHLPLSPRFHPSALYESAFSHVLHFHCSRGGQRLDDDFGLTFAARATASFPGAFSPVGYADVAAEFERARPGEKAPTLESFARRHLPEHHLSSFPPTAWSADRTWMVDGGVLDNRPFGYVVEAIERKPADLQVHRAVVYLEPDPKPSPPPLPPDAPPLALQMPFGLFSLLRQEPIFADLRRLEARNHKIRRLNEILELNREGALAVAAALGLEPGRFAALSPAERQALKDSLYRRMAQDGLAGYAGYVALKARSAADCFAQLICGAMGYPYASRHAHFVRGLVRSWLEAQGALQPGSAAQLLLLEAFDRPFRQRRLRFLVRQTGVLYDRDPALRQRLDAFKAQLADIAFAFEAIFEDNAAVRSAICGALGTEEVERHVAGSLAFTPQLAIERYGGPLATLYAALSDSFRSHAEVQNRALDAAIAGLEGPLQELAESALIFPLLDLVTFPAMYAAEVEDFFPIEVLRISPHEPSLLFPSGGRPPLQCRELGAFAGFLKRSAREHDLLWGRLDGAERLIDLVVAAAAQSAAPGEQAELARRFKREVMRAILAEEAARPRSSIGATIEALEKRLPAPPRDG